MLLLLAPLLAGHVPTYGEDCPDNCCIPEHVDLRLSQVLYLRGSGGIEIPLADADEASHPKRADPLGDTGVDGFRVYFDVVFRDLNDPVTGEAYNVSDFQIWAGCGGCTSEDTPVESSRRTDAAFQGLVIEPFTQTRYYSLFPPDDPLNENFRSFSSNVLLPSHCGEYHVTVRLNDTNAARDSDPERKVRWGAVLGRAESFTAAELVSFPTYVLRNHGEVWNNRETIWMSIPLGILVVLVWRALMYGVRNLCCNGWKDAYRHSDFLGCTDVACPSLVWIWCCNARLRKINPREWLYSIAIVAFNVAAVEMFWHLYIAQFEVEHDEIDRGFWVGIGLILFAQYLPAWLVATIWKGIRYRQQVKLEYELTDCMPCCNTLGTTELTCARWFCFDCVIKRRGAKPTQRSGVYCAEGWACASSPSWLFVEFGTAVSLLFWFGSGFYVAPAALALAAVLRWGELQTPANEVAGVLNDEDKKRLNAHGDAQKPLREVLLREDETKALIPPALASRGLRLQMATMPATARGGFVKLV